MRTKIKCCGFRDVESVHLLKNREVDFVGFILAPSKRQVNLKTLDELVKEVPGGIKKVGVFVNPDFSEVSEVLEKVSLDVIQLHGQESPEFCKRVRETFPVQVIKAFHVGDAAEGYTVEPGYGSTIDYMLLDTYDPSMAGGTGKAFKWEKIAYFQEWCKSHGIELWVAGGITPDNVSDLLLHFQIDGIDVASGVESEGKKDKDKIKTLVERVKGYGNSPK